MTPTNGPVSTILAGLLVFGCSSAVEHSDDGLDILLDASSTTDVDVQDDGLVHSETADEQNQPTDSTLDSLPDDLGDGCPEPAMWWDDFAVPDDPKQGIEPGPPIIPVCMERMPDDWFDAIPCEVWGPEGGFPPDATEVEPVTVRYNKDKKKLIFDFAPEGFEIRSDGVGINWYGDPGDGLVRRLEFTPQRAKFMDFDRTTGKLEGTSVLTPLSEPFCPSTD